MRTNHRPRTLSNVCNVQKRYPTSVGGSPLTRSCVILKGKLVVNVATAVNENAPQKVTVLTLDFDGVTAEQAQAYITKQVKIDLQRGWRKNGIPATAALKVSEHISGLKTTEAATVENTLARASTLSSDELKKLMADLQAKIAADEKPKEKEQAKK